MTKYVRESFTQTDPKIRELKELVAPIFAPGQNYRGRLKSLNKRDILGEIQVMAGSSSYTLDKKKVYLCLFDEHGNYYDDNSLMYCFLHELAHVINTTIGHDRNFEETFDELLVVAADHGIYDPSKPMVQNYCNYQK
jgi:hypothetical protein